MRTLLALLLIAACGGPSQRQVLETPAATKKENLGEAPPASTSDEDRYHMVQQFDDMQTTQEAYREAEAEHAPASATSKPPPRQPGQGAGSAAPAPRKAPVEQAPKQ